jgi:hypothetical protein
VETRGNENGGDTFLRKAASCTDIRRYIQQNYWVSGLCPSDGIVSTTLLGSIERVNLMHKTSDSVSYTIVRIL